MYAVINLGGSQYKVSVGQELTVEKLDYPVDKVFEIDKVLLLVDSEKIEIGQPYLSGLKVEAKVLEQTKGEKIRVIRYKSKVRYRKTKGFRPQLTKIRIEQIGNAETRKSKETQNLKETKKSVRKTVKKSKKE